jgi:hypothetical protein
MSFVMNAEIDQERNSTTMGWASPHDYGRFAAFVILMPGWVFKEAPHGACLSGEFKEGFGNGVSEV